MAWNFFFSFLSSLVQNIFRIEGSSVKGFDGSWVRTHGLIKQLGKMPHRFQNDNEDFCKNLSHLNEWKNVHSFILFDYKEGQDDVSSDFLLLGAIEIESKSGKKSRMFEWTHFPKTGNYLNKKRKNRLLFWKKSCSLSRSLSFSLINFSSLSLYHTFTLTHARTPSLPEVGFEYKVSTEFQNNDRGNKNFVKVADM